MNLKKKKLLNNNIKYLSFKNSDNQSECIMFPSSIGHDTIFSRLNLELKQLIGAGFVDILNINNNQIIKCYGESISLNIKSHKDDSSLLTMNFFGVNSLIALMDLE